MVQGHQWLLIKERPIFEVGQYIIAAWLCKELIGKMEVDVLALVGFRDAP